MKALNILIVDDSMIMRRMVKRVIELTEVEIARVFEAANGREALAIIDANQIDALVTDLNMPEMSGPELLRTLAERPSQPPVRVIVSTDGSDARRKEAEELNVTRYLEKPLRPEVMRDVLCELSQVLSR
jgi:two-component system, chemotaxis family, chemotaxis protein CheY